MESDLIPGVTDVVGARGHDRVRKHTARKVNQQIDLETNACIQKTIAGGRDAIVARVHELDREWDVDRALLTLFGVFGGAAFGLGQRFRGFRYLHAAQLGFMFIHATAGWCPPLPVLRRLGFRTARERSPLNDLPSWKNCPAGHLSALTDTSLAHERDEHDEAA